MNRSSTASRPHCRYRFVQLWLRLPRQRKAHSSTLASERRTRLGSLVASAVAVVPAPGVLMVRLEPELALWVDELRLPRLIHAQALHGWALHCADRTSAAASAITTKPMSSTRTTITLSHRACSARASAGTDPVRALRVSSAFTGAATLR